MGIYIKTCIIFLNEHLLRSFKLLIVVACLQVMYSSLAFAGSHFSASKFVPLTCLGLGLGCLYMYRGRSLAKCVLAHSVYNALVLLLA